MMKPDKLDPDKLPEVLTRFYGRIRKDPDLGPVFNDIVEDWDEHLLRLEDFWSSLMLSTGRYKGNPLAMHRLHVAAISPGMYDRWLLIWAQTTNEMLSPEIANVMQIKATRIAERLKSVMYEPTHGGYYQLSRS
ncbi:group III truncated hemoglobin [Thalassospira sp. MCCC 1A01428]|uniref:group III truncated hemoglobin n=1 Tax=Thalassospira sp. MCCC 1A01428 TaxID=1470575 RepID=UPI000A1E6B62|nr:group III truncated hemoglobin [Thalassospira sp. MCCC 1A01428]